MVGRAGSQGRGRGRPEQQLEGCVTQSTEGSSAKMFGSGSPAGRIRNSVWGVLG